MHDSIGEQLKKATAEKKGGVAAMVENSAVNTESKAETSADESRLIAEKILSDDVVDDYAGSYALSKREYYKGRADVYREELAEKLEEKKADGSLNFGDKKAVVSATVEFLKSKRLTKLLGFVEKNIGKFEDGENEKGSGKESADAKKEGKEEKTEVPKSVEDFERKGFQISTEGKKKYYANKDNEVDVEIVGFDPESQEVTVVFHQEVRVDSQEDGQNVVVFDGAKDVPGQVISYAQFEEKMKGYVLFGPDKKTPNKKENDAESESEFVIAPGKIFRNSDGLKIKIMEMDPKIRGKIQKGNVKVRLDGSGKSEKSGFKTYPTAKLGNMLADGKFREVDTNIKVGGRGTVWQKGKEKFTVLRHERKGREKHDIVVQYANGSGEAVSLGDLKDKIEVEDWKRVETDDKTVKSGQEVASGLEKEEKNTIEDVFLPYTKDHLTQIENFQWGSGYTKEQVSQLKEIERDRLFNNILKSKLTESGLVRKEVIANAIDLLEEETGQMIAEAHESEGRDIEAEKENNSQEKGTERLEEEENKTVENIFIPYAQGYLKDVRAFDWGEEFTEKLASRRVQVEEDRFWGSVLPEKMKETTFIRKEAVSSAVEFAKDKIETESSGEKQATQ